MTATGAAGWCPRATSKTGDDGSEGADRRRALQISFTPGVELVLEGRPLLKEAAGQAPGLKVIPDESTRRRAQGARSHIAYSVRGELAEKLRSNPVSP